MVRNVIAELLDRCVGWLRSGSARGRVAGIGPGLAIITLLLLLGNSVVVGVLPGQIVVPLDRDGGGLVGSERADEENERGERKDVENCGHLFMSRQ